jgi:hypothetical protein
MIPNKSYGCGNTRRSRYESSTCSLSTFNYVAFFPPV